MTLKVIPKIILKLFVVSTYFCFTALLWCLGTFAAGFACSYIDQPIAFTAAKLCLGIKVTNVS